MNEAGALVTARLDCMVDTHECLNKSIDSYGKKKYLLFTTILFQNNQSSRPHNYCYIFLHFDFFIVHYILLLIHIQQYIIIS